MSLLILGKNMPISCLQCGRDLAAAAGCVYTQRFVPPEENNMCFEVHRLCPLRYIGPHDRLIQECDVFCLLDRFLGYLDEDMIRRIKQKIQIEIPTVIDAEEG